jgi:hypothetical protein
VGYWFKARTALVDAREQEIKHGCSTDSSHHSAAEEISGLATEQLTQSLADDKTLAYSDKDAPLVTTTDKALADHDRFSKPVLAPGREK